MCLVLYGVRGYLEKLAVDANWGALALGKSAAKERAKKYVLSKQTRAFVAESAGMSTLVDYVKLTRSGGSGLPVETLTVSGTLIFNQATWGCWDLDGQPRLTAFGLPLLVLRLAVDQLTLL